MLASLMGMVLQCKMVGAEDLTFILHMFGGTNPEKTLPPYELNHLMETQSLHLPTAWCGSIPHF